MTLEWNPVNDGSLTLTATGKGVKFFLHRRICQDDELYLAAVGDFVSDAKDVVQKLYKQMAV